MSTLDDLAIVMPWLDRLSAQEVGAIHHLYWFIASQAVDNMYGPDLSSDPKIKDHDEALAAVVRVPVATMAAMRKNIEPFFITGDGFWRIAQTDWVHLNTGRRLRLAKAVREIAHHRQGDFCAYCGDTEKLVHDHLFPHVRGGSDEANNIVLACGACNSSKQDKTLREWMEAQR